MRVENIALLSWYIVILAIIIVSVGQCITIELTGNSSGAGNQSMEITFPGNATINDSPLLLAYHGYNVTKDGRIWLQGDIWNITEVT